MFVEDGGTQVKTQEEEEEERRRRGKGERKRERERERETRKLQRKDDYRRRAQHVDRVSGDAFHGPDIGVLDH